MLLVQVRVEMEVMATCSGIRNKGMRKTTINIIQASLRGDRN